MQFATYPAKKPNIGGIERDLQRLNLIRAPWPIRALAQHMLYQMHEGSQCLRLPTRQLDQIATALPGKIGVIEGYFGTIP